MQVFCFKQIKYYVRHEMSAEETTLLNLCFYYKLDLTLTIFYTINMELLFLNLS